MKPALLQGDESHKADEYIRFIKDRLPDAVMQCIKAAGEEFIPKIQQSLLMVQMIIPADQNDL